MLKWILKKSKLKYRKRKNFLKKEKEWKMTYNKFARFNVRDKFQKLDIIPSQVHDLLIRIIKKLLNFFHEVSLVSWRLTQVGRRHEYWGKRWEGSIKTVIITSICYLFVVFVLVEIDGLLESHFSGGGWRWVIRNDHFESFSTVSDVIKRMQFVLIIIILLNKLK